MPANALGDGTPVERWFLGNIVNLDESPWDCCPRSFLKSALAALEQETGLRLMASFEQEFHLAGAEQRIGVLQPDAGIRRILLVLPFQQRNRPPIVLLRKQ